MHTLCGVKAQNNYNKLNFNVLNIWWNKYYPNSHNSGITITTTIQFTFTKKFIKNIWK